MILNLFSLPVYKVNLLDWIKTQELENFLQAKFSESSNENSQLEKQGGISTYNTNPKLHLEPFAEKISKLVLEHAKFYWKVLDVDSRLNPKIDQCWANIHYDRGVTLQHSHSLFPMVATFYVRAEKNSGNLILINPMEYGLTHIPYEVPIENKTETAIKVSTGDLVFFPGWIRHKTEENLSTAPRIVMSFNINYSGKYLSSDSDYLINHEPQTSEVEYLQNKILNLEFIVSHLSRSLKNE